MYANWKRCIRYFNLSNKVLSDTEKRVLEKGLDFAPIQNKINEPEIEKYFKEF